MPENKIRALQIRLGVRTAEPLKVWFDQQATPNDSSKRIIEHFVRLYGTDDIDSDEIQIAMARDLLISKGELLPPTKTERRLETITPETITHIQTKEEKTTEVQNKEILLTKEIEEVESKPEPVVEQVSNPVKTPVGNRGQMLGI